MFRVGVSIQLLTSGAFWSDEEEASFHIPQSLHLVVRDCGRVCVCEERERDRERERESYTFAVIFANIFLMKRGNACWQSACVL